MRERRFNRLAGQFILILYNHPTLTGNILPELIDQTTLTDKMSNHHPKRFVMHRLEDRDDQNLSIELYLDLPNWNLCYKKDTHLVLDLPPQPGEPVC